MYTSAWVFSCNFAAYFQNTFSQEHLWVTASEHFDQSLHIRNSKPDIFPAMLFFLS